MKIFKPNDFERFWAKVDQEGEHWLWTASTTKTGYGQINMFGTMSKAHRVAWMMATGTDPGDLHVLHSCDTPLCVRFTHLFLGTNQDNIEDRVGKDRSHGKLTNQQREEIAALEGTMSCYAVAEMYGVGHDYVARLFREKRGFSLPRGRHASGARAVPR